MKQYVIFIFCTLIFASMFIADLSAAHISPTDISAVADASAKITTEQIIPEPAAPAGVVLASVTNTYAPPIYAAPTKKAWYAFSGYINCETLYDTYQSFGAVDNFNIFYPLPPKLDARNNNSNQKGQFNISLVESRVRLTLNGPELCNFDTQGVFECDFTGRKEVLNLARCRHLFLNIKNDEWEIVAGHTWHPFYTTPYVTLVIANNGGNPFETYSRDPQIRVAYTSNNTQISAAILSEVDHLSDGPLGLASIYERNGMTPEFVGTVIHTIDESAFGAGFRFKHICPRTISNTNFFDPEGVNGIALMGFFKTEVNTLRIISRIVYAQNGRSLNLTGGYGTRSIDPVTDKRTYTSLNSISSWIELSMPFCEAYEWGLFCGYIHNLGASHTILPDLTDVNGVITDQRNFGLATKVKDIVRIAPRLTWTSGPIKVAAEMECTRARHGTPDSKGRIQDSTPTTNVRFLLALFYNF